MALMRYEGAIRHYHVQLLNIELGAFSRDERLERIEIILELLMWGLFGSGVCKRVEIRWSWYSDHWVNPDRTAIGTEACPELVDRDHRRWNGSDLVGKHLRKAYDVGVSQLSIYTRSGLAPPRDFA